MIKIRTATINDVDDIFSLTNANASAGLMLSRSKYKIINMIYSFHVAYDEETGKLAGCAALAPLWTDMAEVMSLSVADKFQGKGVGRLLVESLITKAREFGFPKVISLTYQVEFFKKLGFTITDKDEFPRKMWRECLECPKLENCDETAMFIDITREGAQ